MRLTASAFLFASVLTAATIPDHPAFVCGGNLTCQWWEDQEFTGSFRIANAEGADDNRTVFGTGQDFVSPRNYWKVHINKITEMFNDTDPNQMWGPWVSVSGYIQHLVEIGYPTPVKGPQLPFSAHIDVLQPKDYDPDKLGSKDHFFTDHDNWISLLKFTDIDEGAYTFDVGASHRQHLWFYPGDVPEPGTLSLAVVGLAATAARYGMRRRFTRNPRT